MTTLVELGKSAILTCRDLLDVPLASVAGVQGMLLDSVGPTHHAVRVPFHDSQARGKAILIRTGWDEVEGVAPGPYLHEDTVFRLIRARVRLVGVDFGGVECSELVAHEIVVVQNLGNLKSIPRTGFRFFAAPPRIPGTSTPVCAFAECSGSTSH